jgi:alpha-beta hydrolase superfamily lysophospholipase
MAVGTAVAVAAALTACGDGSRDDGSRAARAGARDPRPPFSVGSETVTLVDPTRATPAWNDVAATASRTIETLVLYPARGEPDGAPVPGAPPAAGQHPVVVFLHGASTTAEDYQRAIEPWAKAGYVVVAPTAPLGGLEQSGAARVADVSNHPADVRFALAELPDALDPAVRAIADFDRVAIVGKSLGATTALAVAFDPCCTSTAIQGVVAMAAMQSPHVASGIAVPTLVVHGDADEIVPYSSGRANFDAAPEPKFFLTLLGAMHGPTLALDPAGPTDDAVVATTIDFFDRYLEHHDGALDRLAVHGNVTGVARLEASAPAES